MLKQIEHIRKKPKEVRNRYAFGLALAISIIIFIFWLVSLPARLTVITSQEDVEEVQGGFSRSVSNITDSVSGIWNNFSDKLPGIITPDALNEQDIFPTENVIDTIILDNQLEVTMDEIEIKPETTILIGTTPSEKEKE